MAFDAVVLAGGSSRRFGGADKAMLEVGGRPLLERAVAAVRAADKIVVAGPRRPLDVQVMWVQESPPGAGPVHALAAGLDRVRAELVAVVACDLPFASTEIIGRLLAAVGNSDGALVRDAGGRAQPLLAVYRSAPLRDRLDGLITQGASVRDVVTGLSVHYLADDLAAVDCDTPGALERARALVATPEGRFPS
jgi:molybdopterin-guanine dinucleotide biosynthesis protein A